MKVYFNPPQDRGRFCCNRESRKCRRHRRFGGPSGPRAVLLQLSISQNAAAQVLWQATRTEGGFVAIGGAANAASTGTLASHQDRGRFCCNRESRKCRRHRQFGGPPKSRAVLLQLSISQNAAGTGTLAGRQDRGRFCCNRESRKCRRHRQFGGPSEPRAVLLQ